MIIIECELVCEQFILLYGTRNKFLFTKAENEPKNALFVRRYTSLHPIRKWVLDWPQSTQNTPEKIRGEGKGGRYERERERGRERVDTKAG